MAHAAVECIGLIARTWRHWTREQQIRLWPATYEYELQPAGNSAVFGKYSVVKCRICAAYFPRTSV